MMVASIDLPEIERILCNGLAGCEISLDAEGNHLNLIAVGDVFEDLSRVKRQQLVYALLKAKIASGEVHAVNMRTYTRSEYAAQS